MNDWPTTRASLLIRVRDRSDERAWSEFVDLYAPVVYRYARRQGLQHADAADLSQDVLRSVVGAMEGFEYDRQRGTFRGWLFTVARNKLRNFFQHRRRREQGTGDSGAQAALQQLADPCVLDQTPWDEEYDQAVFRWAAERVQKSVTEQTWSAFWRTAVEGESAQLVADQLGISAGAVYVAKCRVIARLRDEIQSAEDSR